MKFFFNLLFLTFCSCLFANEVTNYLQEYRKTGVSSYRQEQNIIGCNDLENLVNKLAPYYNDTFPAIRQKSYYLTYKKAVLSNANRRLAINILLKGCSDKDGAIMGQNLAYLKGFTLNDFDNESLQMVNLKLSNHRVAHYKDYVLLAGFLGTGKDILYQKFLDEHITPGTKWYISLALARMGNQEQITSCLAQVKKMLINDNLVDYVIPDLIYIRQRESINYCIEVLNNKEKLCHSLNPDISERINCGFRVIEMLAPVIENVPITRDDTGIVFTDSYDSLLDKVRQWFSDNPDYMLKKNTF
jgi:hypothetical protein